RYVAVGPECGLWPDDLAHDPENRPYSEFGCATQRNLAAAIDNPRDLIEPRGTTPRSSERRSRAWDSYVNGESTVSEKSEDEAGNISEIGN
ncbi:MAG: CpaD family pilus assembly lipoprotein, partial [Methyloligellaceae bacterium]